MEFGLEKCATIEFKRGKLVHSQNLMIDINGEIQDLEQGNTYKYTYFGIEESKGIQHQQMKGRLKQEYSRRLGMTLKCELYTRNIITAIGALVVRVEVRYRYN